MGEIGHEALLLNQRPFFGAEVAKRHQQKGRLNQFHRPPTQKLHLGFIPMGGQHLAAAFSRGPRQRMLGVQQLKSCLGMGIQGPQLQNISQGLIHQLNRHATNKEVGRSLIGPVNSAIHIDNHHRFAGRVKSDLKHSKGLPQLRNQLQIP